MSGLPFDIIVDKAIKEYSEGTGFYQIVGKSTILSDSGKRDVID